MIYGSIYYYRATPAANITANMARTIRNSVSPKISLSEMLTALLITILYPDLSAIVGHTLCGADGFTDPDWVARTVSIWRNSPIRALQSGIPRSKIDTRRVQSALTVSIVTGQE